MSLVVAYPYLGPILSEAHWLASADPEMMERFLAERTTLRRWRLFAWHCCARVAGLLADDRSRSALGVVERLAVEADDVPGDVVAAARHEASAAAREAWYQGDAHQFRAWAATAVESALRVPRRAYLAAARASGANQSAEREAQSELMRELFGNPFRLLLAEATWRSPAVLAVAGDIDARRALDELPVLGDALEDAGCDAAVLLEHLRGRGGHVVGCWALDWLLGRL